MKWVTGTYRRYRAKQFHHPFGFRVEGTTMLTRFSMWLDVGDMSWAYIELTGVAEIFPVSHRSLIIATGIRDGQLKCTVSR